MVGVPEPPELDPEELDPLEEELELELDPELDEPDPVPGVAG